MPCIPPRPGWLRFERKTEAKMSQGDRVVARDWAGASEITLKGERVDRRSMLLVAVRHLCVCLFTCHRSSVPSYPVPALACWLLIRSSDDPITLRNVVTRVSAAWLSVALTRVDEGRTAALTFLYTDSFCSGSYFRVEDVAWDVEHTVVTGYRLSSQIPRPRSGVRNDADSAPGRNTIRVPVSTQC